jgi:uncharacterized membrane protein YqgA involved in biofilm formation
VVFTGTIINTITVIVGASLGCILKRGLSEKSQTLYFQVIGLFNVALGVKMTMGMAFPLVVLISLLLGVLLGEWLRIDLSVEKFGEMLKKSFRMKNERFTDGFLSGFLMFCMGSMAIVGSMEEGFGRESDLLLTKSLMDLFSSFMLASALGVGVVFSSIGLFLFQGGITLVVGLIGSNVPEIVIADLTAVGGIALLALGFVLMDLFKMKVINFLPALIFCIVIHVILSYSSFV